MQKLKPICRLIQPAEIECILPLLMQLNTTTSYDVLKERVHEMSTQQYKCVGMYLDNHLIGIAGMWFMTRHYSGRSIEPDHVIIAPEHHNKGYGKILFDWIDTYAKENNYQAVELNSYVRNARSHKFYFNLDFEILGFHFVKNLDK
jgi:GNAT superfamily N-acetyltransferase